MEKQNALSLGLNGGRKAVEDLGKELPFTLTGDQVRSIDEILKDLATPAPDESARSRRRRFR